ncbi:MAG: hypothetical protein MUO26_10475 [Methanotrichaceae archaeon]|nr:hypothetical protein [Methanotrichaceae archaeon]
MHQEPRAGTFNILDYYQHVVQHFKRHWPLIRIMSLQYLLPIGGVLMIRSRRSGWGIHCDIVNPKMFELQAAKEINKSKLGPQSPGILYSTGPMQDVSNHRPA